MTIPTGKFLRSSFHFRANLQDLGVISTISGIFFSYFVGRTRKYRSLVTVSSLIIPLVGTIVVYGMSLDIALHTL